MATYVLLVFDDDEDAKEFVIDKRYDCRFQTHTNYEGRINRVRAVYKKPVKFCACDNNRDGFTRGKKYGWWVCARCGYPMQAWAEGECWFTALGTNLLPKELTGERPQPSGWDSPEAWNFLIKSPILSQNKAHRSNNMITPEEYEKARERIRKEMEESPELTLELFRRVTKDLPDETVIRIDAGSSIARDADELYEKGIVSVPGTDAGNNIKPFGIETDHTPGILWIEL